MDEKRFQKILKQIKALNSQNEEIMNSDFSHLNSINDKSVLENHYFVNSFNFIHFSNNFNLKFE